VFLEGTVVNVALPAMAKDLHLGVDGLQWVVNSYLLTLSALMLLGGALGDRFGRGRVFALGAFGFSAASIACAFAPSLSVLVICRLLQGIAGALLVPNSLAMLEAAFEGEERGVAIGRWAAWTAVSTAIAPLAGGWLVDAFSWRWVFAAVAPFGLVAAVIVWRHLEREESATGPQRIDWLGGALVTLSLAGLVGGLTAGPEHGFLTLMTGGAILAGVGLMIAFLVLEQRVQDPLLPLGVFKSRQFSGANLTTLFFYAALAALFLFLMLELQNALGYSALRAGAAILPVNAIMLVLSPIAGRVSQRMGARRPMTAGALIAALGMALFTRVHPGAAYLTHVLPAVIVFGLGLSVFVAPLTAAVLAAAPDDQVGVASAVNNAVARLAGLLAVAAVPLAAGLSGSAGLQPSEVAHGFVRGMWISAALCLAASVTAWLTISDERSVKVPSET
jgi:EmrB/QacA subfamily drug resistance transporter